jgi:hypothetical protein
MCFTLCVSVSCINLDNLQLSETCNCSPQKNKILILSLFVQGLLLCAEYSLSAEYSAAFSCRIFVFGRNRKIRFRSITSRKYVAVIVNLQNADLVGTPCTARL